MPQPTVFLLEDNRSLADKLGRMATRLGWRVVRARSLEEACRVCADPALKFDAALIDLMIPETDADLEAVDRLLDERNEKSIIVASRTATGPEKEMAGLRIDAIDREIARLIVDDGGIRFLSSPEGHRLLPRPGPGVAVFSARLQKTSDDSAPPPPPRPGPAVAVFSARREGTKTPNERQELMAAVNKALGREPEAWFDKPIDALELESWLTSKG
jgi:CheY-like chemotaxis protein